jgi:hypothetical protein
MFGKSIISVLVRWSIMDRLKALWFAFIVGNIYDIVLSFIAWRCHFIELNPILSSLTIDGYSSLLEALIGLKLIAISITYLILRGVKDYKVLILTIAVIGTMFIVTWDMLNFLAL